jgi:membrane-bound metal-dependent hydrolase YbcI (DUF457 family)
LEPITHAMMSFAMARSSPKRLPRFATSMLIVCGVAPDLDYISFIAGPNAYMRIHRTAFHSILGGALIACGVAAAFCALDKVMDIKSTPNNPSEPLIWRKAFAVCTAGILGHFLIDFFSGSGIQPLWPFYTHWSSLDLMTNLDPWILALLIFGTLVPYLFKLVNDEIGVRKKTNTGRDWTIATLLLMALYIGWRAELRSSAIDILVSHQYHKREPNFADAFPRSNTPFMWFGVVRTDNTTETIEVPTGKDAEFDSNRSLSYYDNDDSAGLDAARKAPAAIRFTKYARFPFPQISETTGGYHFQMRDLQYERDDISPSNIVLLMQLDDSYNVTADQFFYSSSVN